VHIALAVLQKQKTLKDLIVTEKRKAFVAGLALEAAVHKDLQRRWFVVNSPRAKKAEGEREAGRTDRHNESKILRAEVKRKIGFHQNKTTCLWEARSAFSTALSPHARPLSPQAGRGEKKAQPRFSTGC
jgi:hypothetical protein